MEQDIAEAKDELYNIAHDLHLVRSKSDKLPMLFLGGGASVVNHHPFIDELQRQILQDSRSPQYTGDAVESMPRDERMREFEKKWRRVSSGTKSEQVSLLNEKLSITQGHAALASLLQEKCIQMILTTTIDPLIEWAYARSMQPGKPARPLRVLENGRDKLDELKAAFQPSSETTLIKLCGNATTHAITGGEAEAKISDFTQSMREALIKHDLIIVACTLLDDKILQYIFQTGLNEREGNISYFNTEEPSPELRRTLGRWNPNYFISKDLDFDFVFQTIAKELNLVRGAEELKGGVPLNKEESDRLRQASQTSDSPAEAWGQMFKTDISRSARTNTGSLSSASADQTGVPSRTTGTVAQPGPTAGGWGYPPSEEEKLFEWIDEEDENQQELFTLIDTTVLTIRLRPDHRASFTVEGGKFHYSSEDSSELPIDLEELNWMMHDMGQNIATYHHMGQDDNLFQRSEQLRKGWRHRAKTEGIRLYRDLIQAFPDLFVRLAAARAAALQTIENGLENVTLVFEGPRQFLGMPYELLYGDNPLVIEHPLCRKVTGGSGQYKEEHFDNFIHSLIAKKQALRILLIASGTAGVSADAEVLELQEFFQGKMQLPKMEKKPVVKVLLTKDVSIDEVRNELHKCSYHIVHYAGHGVFDEATGENSGLRLWKNKHQAGGLVTLTAREMTTLLGSHDIRLFYLNSCVGAETSDERVLRDNDYLGMTDALVRAGVPYVLGFRWNVTDSNSRTFASSFYQNLFPKFPPSPLYIPERAVLYARQHIYGLEGVNETWTSPILVAQTPYHVTTGR